MRKNRPSRRSRSNGFTRLFGGSSKELHRAPRRRTLERLEERQVLSANVGGNPYFEDQWNLDANGQQTEFDPTSPTLNQTLAEIDNNVIGAWEQLLTGAGVQIGIISGGFDLTHEDLVGNFVTGLAADVLDGDTIPTFTDPTDSNGTAIAGIIGAMNNDLGVVGIAYEADLVPIRAVDGTTETAATSAAALRWRVGMVQDTNGDGIVDGVDNDGDGIVDGYAANEVIDVYFVTGDLLGFNASTAADALPAEIEEAIEDGFNAGRARWVDLDGDGIFDTDEVDAKGAIYVVPAGDDAGTVFNSPAFIAESQGLYDSAQYNGLANSRYTIAVGAVAYDGRYEDNATGVVSHFSEIGPNVLLVAPSGTNNVSQAADTQLNSGILTTDITGEDGQNRLPIFNQELDGDFFPDTDYTSTFGGTEAAAAQVAAVVGLMLEANPELTNRDVERILLMSASQIDQFSETWITNSNPFWQGPAGDNPLVDSFTYIPPSYQYYNLDTNGDGDADLEDVVIPNTPLLSDVFTPGLIAGYFFGQTDFRIPDQAYNDVTGIVTSLSGVPDQELYIYSDVTAGSIGATDAWNPASYQEIPLQFTNDAGYTVSQGYGLYLENIGYAHGMLDAELAVELARAWETNDQYIGESVTVSTPILDAGPNIFIQAAAVATMPGPIIDLVIPGGVSFVSSSIDVSFYEEFGVPVTGGDVNIDGNKIGEVITDAPFFDPDGSDNFGPSIASRASSFVPIEFDQGVSIDQLSIEWIEVTTAIGAGDVDHLRMAIVSPDGGVSDLTPYTIDTALNDNTPQSGQFQQGYSLPRDEAISDVLGGIGNVAAGNGTSLNDIIDGSEDFLIGAVPKPDAVAANTPWTWTTNQHYGSILSTEASNLDNPADIVDDRWYLVLENWGSGSIELDGLQISFHGTETVAQRIQGKIGVDDNAQGTDFYNTPITPGGSTSQNPTPDQLGDGIFNFDRFVEFGELIVDPTPRFDSLGNYYYNGDEEIVTVVLDDEGDAVDFEFLQDDLLTRAYRATDPDTGIESVYPVINRDDYFDFDLDASSLAGNLYSANIASDLQVFDANRFNSVYVNPNLRKTDGLNIGKFSFSSEYRAMEEAALLGEIAIGYHRDGTIGSYQNFDYSQESFAAGVVVQAIQYEVTFDAAGNPTTRTPTGEVQTFVTGADGNYYFDVESIVAPPDPTLDPVAYAEWFNDFGKTFEYDIQVADQDERLWDREYTLDEQEDLSSQVAYNGGGVYTVQLFASPAELSGQTTTVRDVNFLLAVDLAEVQVTVSGDVIRDLDGDGVLDPTDGIYAGVRAYYDANTNGQFDAGEVEAITDSSGAYELQFDPSGEETISIRLDETTYPEPLRAITPINASQQAELVLTNFDPGDSFAGQDFFLKPTASFITGSVWQDTDEDGVFDASESAVDGTALGVDGTNVAVFVYYDADNNGVFNAGDVRADVDASGNYNLEFVNPGTYVIRIDTTNADFSQTFPFGGGAQFVTLLAEETSEGVNFGVKDQRVFDYGDLPDTYGTVLGSDGARHRVTGNVYLGASAPDLELDGQPTINSDGDDNDGNDDEDGVKFASADVQANSTIEFDITATGGGALLNAWVDFNNNGVFEASEQVFDDVADLGTGVETRISAPTPASVAGVDRYAARFRWGPFGLGPTGVANDGEVEDLWLTPDAIIVSGEVRRDADNDAVFEDADSPRAGVRVFFDKDLDGVRDPDEPSSVTNAAGQYSFEVTPNGIDTPITIRIEESTLAVNEGFLDPTDGIIAELGDPGELITANFLLTPLPRPTQAITGTVFADLNNNGSFDEPGEGGFDSITVELLQNIDGDPALEVIQSTTTNPSGVYSFGVENTGLYEVRIVLPSGGTLVQTTPGGDTVQVAVTTGETVTAPLFGVFDQRSTYTRDYGDLSMVGGDSYPTTVLQEGPSHLVVEGVFLGAGVDADSGQLTSTNGSADDTDFTDDEDGVILLSEEIVAGGAIEFDVTATGDASSRLNMWVDFDDNGVFDADEQIVTDLALVSGVTTQINRVANADTSPTATLLAVRTRWGTAGVGPDDVGLSEVEKAAIVGEVEDQFVRTSQPGVLVSPIVGDFDGSGVVDTADEQFWRLTYGMVGAGLAADANGNGRVDAGDYTIWRDAYADAQSAAAFAAASAPVVEEPAPVAAPVAEEPVAIPPVVTMPIEEEVLEPVSYDANAFAPIALLTATQTAAVDESLSVEEETADSGDDAIAAALLEWSFEGVAEQDDEEVETAAASDDESEEATDSALAEAFAL